EGTGNVTPSAFGEPQVVSTGGYQQILVQSDGNVVGCFEILYGGRQLTAVDVQHRPIEPQPGRSDLVAGVEQSLQGRFVARQSFPVSTEPLEDQPALHLVAGRRR